jgi:hypothetical protein
MKEVRSLLLLKDGRVCISCVLMDSSGCALIYDLETEECDQLLDGSGRMLCMTELNGSLFCCKEPNSITVFS